MKTRDRLVLCAVVLFVPVSSAGAQSLCVACSEPKASYRCEFEGTTPGLAGEPGLQLACIKELATRGGHRKCSIDRVRATGPCDAPLAIVARPILGAAPVDLSIPAASPIPAAAGHREKPLPDGTAAIAPTPPETMEELAKAAVDETKKDWATTNAQVKKSTAEAGAQIEKAGNTVGKAVKKSWDCVTSLFARC